MIRSIAVLALGLLTAGAAQAVPWCHRGYIYDVATINFTGQYMQDWLNNNVDPNNPPNTNNINYYVAFEATYEACSVYASAGGPGSSGVPGAGQVEVEVTAPYSLTSGLNYQLWQGVQFNCRKCYAHPVAIEVPHELEHAQ